MPQFRHEQRLLCGALYVLPLGEAHVCTHFSACDRHIRYHQPRHFDRLPSGAGRRCRPRRHTAIPKRQSLESGYIESRRGSELGRYHRKDWDRIALRAEFGSGKYAGSRIGIPYIIVSEAQPMVRVDFTSYATNSDPGPYPIPQNAPIEGLGAAGYNDRHMLVVQRDCSKPNGLGRLFETFRTFPVGGYPASVPTGERPPARAMI